MGLSNFLQKASRGDTSVQNYFRALRANGRGSLYMEVSYWHLEMGDGMPGRAVDYDDLVARFTFRQEHRVPLNAVRADVERKLGHAAAMGLQNTDLFLSVFPRPSDDTVAVFFVALRDNTQNFLMLKPYWFLSAGEKESDFRRKTVDFMGANRHG